MNKKLKIALITLIVILISMISFVGIYKKSLNSYTNIMKEYLLSRNLKGSRVVELTVKESESTEDEESTESTTNEVNTVENTTVESDIADENNTAVENTTVENQTSISKENLKTAKKVFDKRLKDLGADDFVIQQNQENGETTIYLTENDLTDNITGYLTSVGKFTIVDSEDSNNVLMTNNDLKVAKVGYSQATSGTTVYLSIEFNKDGKKKLEDISNTYVKTTDEEGNETEKKITMKIDDTEILSTSFDETLSTGILQMSIGKASTSSSELQEYILQASGIATLLNDGQLPIEYTMEKNEYVGLDNVSKMIQIAIIASSIVIALIFVGIIFKYRANGLKVCITNIGAIAIFLLLIRYTNVYIAIESIAAIAILIIEMAYLSVLILKNKKEKIAGNIVLNAYKNSWKVTVPILVLAVVLSFISWTPIASIGMLLLWGLISIAISNFIFTLPILNDN